MRFVPPAVLTGLLLTSIGAFGAVPTGDEVSVNPLPAGGGTVLLYPGGQYMRVMHPLLQPGETAKDSGPIRLHMPTRHVASTPAPREDAAVAPPKAAAAPEEAAVAPAPKRAPAPRVARAAPPPASPAPAPSSGGYDPGYGAFGAPQGAAGLNLGAAPSRQVARAEPPPSSVAPLTSEAPTPGLTKRSVILFAAGAADPAESALGAIKFLAGDLNGAMASPASRVQLLAYGGNKGDKGSDARRLSLKRALAIRQVLIDDGVPSERIDVRAMGGADDGGPADRVDVFVKA